LSNETFMRWMAAILLALVIVAFVLVVRADR
jgi:hypothetical protein